MRRVMCLVLLVLTGCGTLGVVGLSSRPNGDRQIEISH